MANINEKNIEAFLTKIRDDSAFALKISESIDPQDVQNVAKDSGIELTMDDIMAAKEAFVKAADIANQKELTDEDLENVAGGFFLSGGAVASIIVAIIAGSATVSAAGLAAGATVGAAAIGGTAGIIVASINNWKW